MGFLRRWDVTRLASKKTCVYKPSALDGDSGGRDNLRRAMLGAVYSGDYQKVPRGNGRVSLIWEVRVQSAKEVALYEFVLLCFWSQFVCLCFWNLLEARFESCAFCRCLTHLHRRSAYLRSPRSTFWARLNWGLALLSTCPCEFQIMRSTVRT